MKNGVAVVLLSAVLVLAVFVPTLAQTTEYPTSVREKAWQNSAETSEVANSFQTWLQELAAEAVAEGISSGTVQNALAGISLDERVIARDQNQPEQTEKFATYAAHTVNVDRVTEGRAQLHKHARVLKEISLRYGVPPEIIVALWGMESGFGRNIGGFEVVDSLATLAYEGRRAYFFRKQLIDALRILDEEHMPSSALRGSWAGALGQCQFMPSTYLKYAVDYDGSGRRDIWDNEADVFASIANYLAAEGWRSDLSWGRAVKLRKALPETQIGLDNKRSLTEWQKLGVRDAGGKPLPNKPIEASLVQPDGLDGRSFLVYDNFRALMRWNRSTYFAASVGLLADRLKLSR